MANNKSMNKIKAKGIKDVQGIDLNLDLLTSEIDSESTDDILCYDKDDFEDSEQVEQYDTFWTEVKEKPFVVALTDYAFVYEVTVGYHSVIVVLYEFGGKRLIIFDREDRNRVRTKLMSTKKEKE